MAGLAAGGAAAETADDVVACLDLSDAELRALGEAARARILAAHTNDVRVQEPERRIERVLPAA